MKTFKNIIILMFIFCTIFCGGCSLPFQKYDTCEVLSGSMKASGFEKGDKVLIKQVDTDKLRVGDIISFYYFYDNYDNYFEKVAITDFNNLPFADSDEINYSQRTTKEQLENKNSRIYFHHIHKVYISEEGIRYFQTKGSSNASPDTYLTREDFVIGQFYKKL